MRELAAKLDRPGLDWIISCRVQCIGYALFVVSYLWAGNTVQRILFYSAIVVPFVLFIGNKALYSVLRSPLFLISILLMVYLWVTVLWSAPGGLALLGVETRRIWMLGIFIAVTAFFSDDARTSCGPSRSHWQYWGRLSRPPRSPSTTESN